MLHICCFNDNTVDISHIFLYFDITISSHTVVSWFYFCGRFPKYFPNAYNTFEETANEKQNTGENERTYLWFYRVCDKTYKNIENEWKIYVSMLCCFLWLSVEVLNVCKIDSILATASDISVFCYSYRIS
jgi:hypothetical protein